MAERICDRKCSWGNIFRPLSEEEVDGNKKGKIIRYVPGILKDTDRSKLRGIRGNPEFCYFLRCRSRDSAACHEIIACHQNCVLLGHSAACLDCVLLGHSAAYLDCVLLGTALRA